MSRKQKKPAQDSIGATPEEQELQLKRDEIQSLSEQLAEAELELTNLRFNIKQFTCRYYQEIGRKYLELDELKARIAEERNKLAPLDREKSGEALLLRAAAEKIRSEVEDEEESEELHHFNPTDELKRMYRQCAAKIHPDKVLDPKFKEICHRLMAELNAAYARGDISKIREISLEWDSNSELVSGEGVAFDLVRAIRSLAQIRMRLSTIKSEIEDLKELDMYTLMLEVELAEHQGMDLLGLLGKRIDENIRLSREILDDLLAGRDRNV
ncbi:MAG: J domain-containing protein [Candidatus Wallbacteria bacterium]|nr:J domain-containing protein [Candidatus Wallbacteria bacterium]